MLQVITEKILRERVGTVRSRKKRRFSSASSQMRSGPVDFIVYLARILLNYDKASSSWWQTEVVPAVDASLVSNSDQKRWQQMRAAKLREIFADYAASVEIGLRRYQEEGRRKSGLLKKLVDRYGDTQEGRRQLALAFTLLDDQPLELLSSLLSSLQRDACICVVVNSCQLTNWLKVILISQVRRLKLVQLLRLQLYTKHMIIRDIAKLQLLIYPIWMFLACCFPSWFFFMSFAPLYCTEDTRLQAVFSPALSDYLAMDPTRLLPITQYPVWNGGKGRWVIPGSWPHFRYALFCTPSKKHFLHFWAIWLFLNKSHQSRPHQSEVCDGSHFI